MRILVCFTLIISSLFFSFCLKWKYTSEGGVRLVDSKKFKYNNQNHKNLNWEIIDTNAVYKLISDYDWRHKPGEKPPVYCHVIRFFSGGQVLFYNCDKASIESMINNPNSGIPGYFIVNGNQIRIERWSGTNGGQLEKYFGILQNHLAIKFYEQAVRTCHGSYDCLEKQNMYSIWEKQSNLKLIHYQPDW